MKKRSEMSELKDKVIVVTGAGSGIGRETSIYLSSLGANIVCIDINADANDETVDRIIREGSSAVGFSADISNSHHCNEIVKCIIDRYSRIDILFNNAGIIRRNNIIDTSEEEWDMVVNTNLKSVYLMSKYVIPVMIKSNAGSIINTASGWGINGGANASSYCASKGGVVLLTKSMAIDFGKYNIRVNCICPGDTDTNMLRGEADQLDVSYESIVKDGLNRPLGRIGQPKDIANGVEFLASSKSAFMTGGVLVVDGGSLAGSP